MTKPPKNKSTNISTVLNIISELKIPFILTNCCNKEASIIYDPIEQAVPFSNKLISSEKNYSDIFKSILMEKNIKSGDIRAIKKRVVKILKNLSQVEADYFSEEDLMFAYIPSKGFYWHKYRIGREYSTILTSNDLKQAVGWKKF